MSSNQQNFSDKGIAMDGAPLKPLNESAPQPALRTPKTPQNNKCNNTPILLNTKKGRIISTNFPSPMLLK